MTKTKLLTPLKRFKNLLKVDKKDITQVYIYALLNGLVNLSLPLGIQAIINLIQGGEVSTSWIILVGFVILGIAVTGILQMMQLRIVENISQKIFSRASFEFAYRIPRIKYMELYNYYAPELANRFFDTMTIQKGLSKILIDFSLAAFQIIAGLVVLSLYHPFFILFGVALVAIIYTILAFSGPRGMRTSLQESKHKYEIAHWLEEIARTKVSLKLASDQDIALQYTDSKVSEYLEARESHFSILISQFLYLIGFKVLIAAGLLIIGGLLVFNQEMNIGQFVAAEIIIILIISSVEKLIRSLDSIYDVLTALEKIGYVTDMELDDEKGMAVIEELNEINFSLRDISFAYPQGDKKIIDQMNLEFRYGESTCIMGPAGSGKSTLMRLISGIYPPSSGNIMINGLSISSLDTNLIRRNIGYCLTNNEIFWGSLYDNIAMVREDVGLEEVMWAIDLLNLHDFLKSLPNGLQTCLDPEGTRIPGSVVNKIILARAIVNSPKLLLLEDPLDHVSHNEKEQIIAAITDTRNPWTIIITTVDSLWTKYIDRVLSIENGKIIQS